MASEGTGFMPGPVTGAFLWPLRVAVLSVLVVAGVWLAAVAWQTWYAQRDADPDTASAILADVLEQDIQYAGERPGCFFNPLSLGYAIGSNINDLVFGAIFGVARTVMNLPANWQRMQRRGRPGNAGPDDGRQQDVGGAFAQQQLSGEYGGWTRAVSAANMIFCVRTAELLSIAPLALLLYVVAVTDGYAARAERRACAGRESAGLYHRAKLGQIWGPAAVWMAYLALPVSVHPAWFTLGATLCAAALARVQAKWTKKYL